MGLSAQQLETGLDSLAANDARIAAALEQVGYPAPRIRPRGYRTLLRTIVGQQVSVAAASAMWNRLEAELGEDFTPADLLSRDFDTLRACGLSRQKQGYARSLCEAIEAGTLDLGALPADEDGAVEMLTQVKGIGRWSAEIYLLFAEGRPDIWPAGDLAVQEGMRRLLDMDNRPKEPETRTIGSRYAPHRGALAIFTWHYYSKSSEPV